MHAYAAGELERAAHGWLLAGRSAMGRSAVEDAIALYDRAVDVAADPSLRARVLLARALAHEASTAYAPALADIDEALALAQRSGDRRLEMAALRARGGDPADRPPAADGRRGARPRGGPAPGHRARRPASPRRISTAASRSSDPAASGWRRRCPGPSSAWPGRAPRRPRKPCSSPWTGSRTCSATSATSIGCGTSWRSWLLRCASASRGGCSSGPSSSRPSWPPRDRDWDTARSLVREALDINARSGFTAYAGYFHAHLGWFERLSGDLDAALSHGRAGRRRDVPGRAPVVVRHRRRPAGQHPRRPRRHRRGRRARASRARRRRTRGTRGVAAAVPGPAGAGRGGRRRRRGVRRGERAARGHRVPARAGLGERAPTATCCSRDRTPARATTPRSPHACSQPLREAVARHLGRGPRAGRAGAGSEQLGHQLSRARGAVRRAPGR